MNVREGLAQNVYIYFLIALALVASFAWYYHSRAGAEQLPGQSSFAKGEYYFNADDDPNGPYDLVLARKHYEDALAASSTAHSAAWYQLGRINFLEGSFDAAIKNFENQIEYFGNRLPQVHYMLGLTYAYRAKAEHNPADWEAATSAFNAFLQHKPDSPWARTDLAWVYFAQGKFEEMLPILNEGFTYHPKNPWLHNMYGLAMLNLGRSEEAVGHFMLAEEYAASLTEHEWGLAYPGNDPGVWGEGLASFRDAIAQNLELARAAHTGGNTQ